MIAKEGEYVNQEQYESLRQELTERIKSSSLGLRKDIKKFKSELEASIENIEARINSKIDNIKWIVGVGFAILGLVTGYIALKGDKGSNPIINIYNQLPAMQQHTNYSSTNIQNYKQ